MISVLGRNFNCHCFWREVFYFIFFNLLCFLSIHIASAQNYPTRPIKIISGFAPGGGTDIAAREVAGNLSKILGESVYVENKPGGSGNIAAAYVANSPADGYTIYLANTTVAMPLLFKRLNFDINKDLISLSLIGYGPSVLLVNPSFQPRSVKELVEYIKKYPGKFNYASGGIGNITHMTAALFISMSDIDVVHIPYKGGAPSLVGLIGGEAQFGFFSIASSLEFIKGGQLIPIAVSPLKRSLALPDVSTVAEAGLPGFDATSWYGLMLPNGVPVKIVNQLSNAMKQALENPVLVEKLTKAGIDPVKGGSDEFDQFLKLEIIKWKKIIVNSKINAD